MCLRVPVWSILLEFANFVNKYIYRIVVYVCFGFVHDYWIKFQEKRIEYLVCHNIIDRWTLGNQSCWELHESSVICIPCTHTNIIFPLLFWWCKCHFMYKGYGADGHLMGVLNLNYKKNEEPCMQMHTGLRCIGIYATNDWLAQQTYTSLDRIFIPRWFNYRHRLLWHEKKKKNINVTSVIDSSNSTFF